MKLLRTHYHPSILSSESQSIFTRLSTRAICVRDNKILLLYTKRYDDYSLPGGGLDSVEDKIEGMKRELVEETGAKNIKNIMPFGIYEEYRPWYKDDFDIQHMISYCYTCDVDEDLGDVAHEPHEISNVMIPKWVELNVAISHNEKTIAESSKKGMSIERETFLLRLINKSVTSINN